MKDDRIRCRAERFGLIHERIRQKDDRFGGKIVWMYSLYEGGRTVELEKILLGGTRI